ncbi:MAG: 2-oxoacid:acceptor oxidoreductase family protein [Desulfobacterales bacterium]|nr:2-oxoacid:acceptor oxidoreductase family protein [Desulfobacterales bacterium]
MTDKHKKSKKEIIITGFGGQGIIMAGRILGRSAALGDRKESVFTQSYGPESRGGACNAQVVISEEPIRYPYVRHPDILICMSQTGYEKFIMQMTNETILLIDQDLVHLTLNKCDSFSIPATRMAEELGRKMMANIIMLGFCTTITKVVSIDAALDSVADSVPKGTEETNIRAFKKGFDYGLAILKGRDRKAVGKTGAV